MASALFDSRDSDAIPAKVPQGERKKDYTQQRPMVGSYTPQMFPPTHVPTCAQTPKCTAEQLPIDHGRQPLAEAVAPLAKRPVAGVWQSTAGSTGPAIEPANRRTTTKRTITSTNAKGKLPQVSLVPENDFDDLDARRCTHKSDKYLAKLDVAMHNRSVAREDCHGGLKDVADGIGGTHGALTGVAVGCGGARGESEALDVETSNVQEVGGELVWA